MGTKKENNKKLEEGFNKHLFEIISRHGYAIYKEAYKEMKRGK